MKPFEENNIKYLALELPDDIKHYKYNGNFDGELSAIERYLSHDVSEAMKIRLFLETVIAQNMKNDYKNNFDDLLAALVEKHPKINAENLEEIINLGHVDYILKSGERYFQNSAASNIVKCCGAYIYRIENGRDEQPCPNELLHKVVNEMQEKGSMAYRFEIFEKIAPKKEFVREGKTLRAYLPYPCACQEQDSSRIKLLSSSHNIKISNAPQRTAFFEEICNADTEFSVSFSYVNKATYHELSASEVLSEQPGFYTDEQYPHIIFTPFLRSLAKDIAGNEKNPLLVAKRVYDYITKNVKYSYMRAYLLIDNIPQSAALNNRGDCGVQALLFITLCRILGIPARWQSGSSVELDSIGSHDWAQLFVAPYGWLPVDPSYGGGAFRNGDMVLHSHYFGNLDPYRLIACTEFQSPFEPAKHYLRTDPYDNQSGEIEYSDRELFFGEYKASRMVLGYSKLKV